MDGDGHLADGGFLSRDAEARIRGAVTATWRVRWDGFEVRGWRVSTRTTTRVARTRPSRPSLRSMAHAAMASSAASASFASFASFARARVGAWSSSSSGPRAPARVPLAPRAPLDGAASRATPRGVRASPSDDGAPGDPPAPKRGNRNRRNRRNRRGSSTSEPGDAGGPSKPRRPPRASEGAVALASAASTTTRFMGTLDADDELAPNLPDPSTPARAAVFKGTIDDGDLDIFAGGRAGGDRGESSSPAALTPPPDGNPDLAFLYDPETVASVASDPSAGVNAPEVVGRCNDVVRACRDMNDVLAAVREMTAAGIAPGESTYFAIMLVCRKVDGVGFERAVEVYDAMRLNGVEVSRRAYEVAVECATRAKRVDDAIRVKDDAAAAGVPIGPKLMTSVLRCAADVDAGRKRGAKHRLIRTCRIFEEMLADGAVPPPAAFAALVSAAKRARQPDLVARTFEEMVATGVTPSRETYEDALSAVSAGGLADVALDVFAAMRRDGFDARKSTYNSLLEACAAAPQPRVEQAFEIFYRMTDEGRVEPNARTFALLIDAATRAGRPEYAFDAFEAMRASDADIPLATYNRLIRAAGQRPDGVAIATRLLAEIRSDPRLKPDAYTWGSALAACADAGDADAAAQLVREMLASGGKHTRVTRHAYMATLGRANRWEEAMAEYREMRGEPAGSDAAPARETYSVAFDALLAPGGAEAAIAAVALEVGEGDGFIHGARAAAARAVFRDGVAAGAYEDPVAKYAERADAEPADAEMTVPSPTPAALRVSVTHMTRSEAVVATLALLESLAKLGRERAPAGVVIDAGPGTKGNAQRRALAVESVLRAANLPCEELEDPGAYVVGVDGGALRRWTERVGEFDVVDVASGEKKNVAA